MDRSGLPWTIQEAFFLYKLIQSEETVETAQKLMGRSEKAFAYKLVEGGLYTKDLAPVVPRPTITTFIRNLRKKRKIPKEAIPTKYSSGKISKAFKKCTTNFYGIHSIPINKQYLVPKLSKKECHEKYNSEKPWWKFSSDAQSNPYMRSAAYKKYEGYCAYCGDALSEGEYQAHHSCYDHVCTYNKKIKYTNSRNKEVYIPDCQSCHANYPEKFAECLSRLHAVHGMCNKKLYELE